MVSAPATPVVSVALNATAHNQIEFKSGQPFAIGSALGTIDPFGSSQFVANSDTAANPRSQLSFTTADPVLQAGNTNFAGLSEVRVGTTGDASFFVQNIGPDGTTLIGSAELQPGTPDLQMIDFNFNLPTGPTFPDTFKEQAVSYTPTARGPDSRTIAIFSNGLGSTDQNARTDQLVSGIGVGPVFDSSVASIDFGPVEVGTMATSPLQISCICSDLF